MVLQTLQVLQLVLFIIPIAAWVVLGILILVKPVLIFNRYWYLLLIIPLLFANLIAIVGDNIQNPTMIFMDWWFWVLLMMNAGITVAMLILFKGFQVFGLDESEAVNALIDFFEGVNLETTTTHGERKNAWLGKPDVVFLKILSGGKQALIWITQKTVDLSLGTNSKQGISLLKQGIKSLRAMNKPYDLKRQAIGLLYLMIAVVIGVLGWIFFFEPRLIFIE